MFKIGISIAIATASLLANSGNKELVNKIEALPFVKQNGFKVKELGNRNGLHTIYAISTESNGALRGVKFYSDSKLQNFITGQQIYIIDTKTGEEATEQNVDLNKHQDKELFTIGNGAQQLYLFTDPECPYCRQFDEELSKMTLHDVTIHVMLYPLPFHNEAVPMSNYILDKKTPKERHAALSAVMSGDMSWKNYNGPDHKNEMSDTILLGLKANLTGTPFLSTADGHNVNIQKFMSSQMEKEQQKYPKIIFKPASKQYSMDAISFLEKEGLVLTLNPDSKLQPLYIFTDTECSTCQDLVDEPSLKALAKKYEVKLVLIPNVNHEKSFIETFYILAGKSHLEKLSRFSYLMKDNDISAKQEDEINKAMKAGDARSKELVELVQKVGSLTIVSKKMGITGTPTFIDGNGKGIDPRVLYKDIN